MIVLDLFSLILSIIRIFITLKLNNKIFQFIFIMRNYRKVFWQTFFIIIYFSMAAFNRSLITWCYIFLRFSIILSLLLDFTKLNLFFSNYIISKLSLLIFIWTWTIPLLRFMLKFFHLLPLLLNLIRFQQPLTIRFMIFIFSLKLFLKV